jgi:transketolase
MAALCNGLALHGGFIPYSATFLVFSDYARNALRMAALMGIRQIFVFTHDSIGLGEDGPTHQPVEHMASLRLIPNMSVWRPCDAVETAVAWRASIERIAGPSSLALSRQNLPHQARDQETLANIARGGYILRDCRDEPQVILIATGSEVELAMQAADVLSKEEVRARVVSMPSTDVFDAQDVAYRESVLPPKVKRRVAIEAGVSAGWLKYVGLEGSVVGLDRFGESAPAEVAFEYFGFNVENVTAKVRALL